jgi:aldose 1-epimerase
VPAVRLRSAELEALVLPEAGGGLAAFDWIAAGRRVALMRALPAGITNPDPNLLACYPLVPWSNRIGHGRFEFGGRVYSIALNHPKQQYPIHGEGWLRPWNTIARDDMRVTLRLDRSNGFPFVYSAQLSYTLDANALAIELAVENRGGEPMLYGLGLHPWFERTPRVTLHAPAKGMWLGGPDVLPVSHDAPPADADFSQPTPLPRRLLDNCFTGWNGAAVIAWEDRGVALEITSDPRLDYYVCFCPVGKDLFCFEPVTHPIDAFNLPAPHARAGLQVLAPGAGMSMRATMRARSIPSASAAGAHS